MPDCKLKEVLWIFPIPGNWQRRYIIQQRKDGPFATDPVGGIGHYYTCVEEHRLETWYHVDGSTQGAFISYEKALANIEYRIREFH